MGTDPRDRGVNDHAVSAGLSVELGPPRDAPALALSEAEQRRLLDRVDRLADSMLSAAPEGAIVHLRQSVGLLIGMELRDLVRQGRGDELGPLLAEAFGSGNGPAVERRFREWMARIAAE